VALARRDAAVAAADISQPDGSLVFRVGFSDVVSGILT